MSTFAPRPIGATSSAIESVVAFLDKLLASLMNTGIVGGKEKGIKRRRSWSPEITKCLFPLVRDAAAFLVDGDEIDPGASMRDVVLFRVDATMCSTIALGLEILFDTVPRRVAYVFENHNRRPMVRHPRHHASECAT